MDDAQVKYIHEAAQGILLKMAVKTTSGNDEPLGGSVTSRGITTMDDAQVEKIQEVLKMSVKTTSGKDEPLAGGTETSSVRDASEKIRTRTGKTHLSPTLSSELPTNMKGDNGKVAYIARESTFQCDGIVHIAERFGGDPGATLDNPYNLLGRLASIARQPFCLMIVDSAIDQLRVTFTGREETADRQQNFAQILSAFIKLAHDFDISVYVTNKGCIGTSCIKDALAHNLSVPLSMPLSSETAIMAMAIKEHFFLGSESKISPGDIVDYEKIVWITRSVAIATSGMVRVIEKFKAGIHDYIRPRLGDIPNIDCLAQEVKKCLEEKIDLTKLPHSAWELALDMVGYHKGTKGIFSIRRIGDKKFKVVPSPKGLLDGTGMDEMEKLNSLHSLKVKRFETQGAYVGDEEDLIRFGKSTVFKNIAHA